MADQTQEPEFNDQQIGTMFRELWEENVEALNRLRLRRYLIDIITDDFDGAWSGSRGGSHAGTRVQTGTYLPPPFDESQLIIKSLIGDVPEVLNNYTARIAANEPQLAVVPISADARTVGKKVEERAAEQERLGMAMWSKNHGRTGQFQVARSQAWAAVGWYLTLPRDATWGLPDRKYFDELTDDEIAEMQRNGNAVQVGDDGSPRFAEPAASWMERRRAAAIDLAPTAAGSLTTLEAWPADMVIARYDHDGTAKPAVKYGFAFEEIPVSEFSAGSEMAIAAAEHLGMTDPAEIAGFEIMLTDDAISGGATAGGEPGSQTGQTWTLARFVTRDEVYYYVTESPGIGTGKTIYYDRHGGGSSPLVPVPAQYGDSGRPGNRYKGLMDGIFAAAPLLNQIETLLSNVATWNALGRFVVEVPDGEPLFDGDGEPTFLKKEELIPGAEPGQVVSVRGKIRQLTLDADLLLQLLQHYDERMDLQKPSPVTEGTAGASAAAWQVRQLLASSGELLKQSVDNHAAAVEEVHRLWIRWARMLNEPLFVFAVPGQRSTDRTVRGLIEFDPKDLVESITVNQNPLSAQERIVLDQAGIEKRNAGLIDDRQYYEEFALAPDPEEAEKRANIQRVKEAVLYGNLEGAPPGSVLGDVVMLVRGQLSMQMFERAPAFANATAETMAIETAMAVPPPPAANVANATGTVQPGMGMSTAQGGSPGGQAPEGVTV